MIARPIGVLLVALCSLSYAAGAERGRATELPTAALPKPDADGFITLFNGHDLTGWAGLADYWSAKDGEISGHQVETSKQTFLILLGITVRDFELHFKYRFASPAGNSGLQFRSRVLDAQAYRVGGYQADFDAERRYDGTIYDEAGVAGGRETMSHRGERTTWDADNYRHAEPFGQSGADLQAQIRTGDWNEATIVARGNHIVYSINGRIMTDLVDGSPAALQSGALALQLHQGFTMDVRFKDLRIKLLD
jgi:3-keto-disaccharide hydrolase